MEACKCFYQTARAITMWSRWKTKTTLSLLSVPNKKSFFESGRFFSSILTSHTPEVPYPLTKEEALSFLDKQLRISPSRLNTGIKSTDFLNDVVNGLKKVLPFTNMNLLAGKFPDLAPEDFKHHIMSRQGGTCLWINPFTKVLLEHLGHVAYHIPGIIHPVMYTEEVTHISTVVSDITNPGSRHLVDPGLRYELHGAVPLDFERESPVYTFQKFEIKFFKTEDDILLLCIPSSAKDPDQRVKTDSKGKSWQLGMEYRLNNKIAWSTFVAKWQQHARHGMFFMKPFNSLFFFAFLNEKLNVRIMSSDGQTHATYYNLEENSTEQVTMTRTELMNFFLESYPQYSVEKLEKVFEVSKLV